MSNTPHSQQSQDLPTPLPDSSDESLSDDYVIKRSEVMQEISEKSLDKDDKEEGMVMSLSDGEIIPEENDLKEGSGSKRAHIHQQESQSDDELEEISCNEFGKFKNSHENFADNLSNENENLSNYKDGSMNEEIYNGDQMVMLQECKKKKAYNYMFNKWWMSNENEVPENSVTIWNIDPEVDEEIIYELFSKVGKIKKMKLFRFTSADIKASHYLQSLPSENFQEKSKPHKRKALVEYHSADAASAAIKVFNGLSLFRREIHVKPHKYQEPPYQIHFVRKKGVDGWLDEFFCLDYFSSFTNVLNVRNLHEIKRPDSRRFIVLFPTKGDWLIAKDKLKEDLKKYLSRGTLFYSHSKLKNKNDENSHKNEEQNKGYNNDENEEKEFSPTRKLSPTPKKIGVKTVL